MLYMFYIQLIYLLLLPTIAYFFRNMHKQLVENKEVTAANMSQVIEILRVLAEMVVYGDAKSELLFDFFCEANMLALFLEIMRSPSRCPMQVRNYTSEGNLLT
jgi:hypothetical protein